MQYCQLFLMGTGHWLTRGSGYFIIGDITNSSSASQTVMMQ